MAQGHSALRSASTLSAHISAPVIMAMNFALISAPVCVSTMKMLPMNVRSDHQTGVCWENLASLHKHIQTYRISITNSTIKKEERMGSLGLLLEVVGLLNSSNYYQFLDSGLKTLCKDSPNYPQTLQLIH